MSKVLKQPYTADERAMFINANQSVDDQRIELVINKKGEELMVYALLPNEVLVGYGSETEVAIDEERPKRIEEENIMNLTMTALDFVTFVNNCGVTDDQLDEYLDNNRQLKKQLTYCQNVYCRVVCQIVPITIGEITITKDMVIEAFKNKYKIGE